MHIRWKEPGGQTEPCRQTNRQSVSDEDHVVFTGRGDGEGGEDGGEHQVRRLFGVDGPVEAEGTVVVDQWRRLAVVCLQSGTQRCLVIITTAGQGLARQLVGREGVM